MGVDGMLTVSSIPFPWNLIPFTVLLAPGILPSQTWDPGGDKSISPPSLLPTLHLFVQALYVFLAGMSLLLELS